MITAADMVYLSGPISIFAHNGYNFRNFLRVELELRNQIGCVVLNPCKNFGGRTDLPKPMYMREDFGMVLRSTALVLLDDWQKSMGGVQGEVVVAWNLGLPFYDERLNPINLMPKIAIKIF